MVHFCQKYEKSFYIFIIGKPWHLECQFNWQLNVSENWTEAFDENQRMGFLRAGYIFLCALIYAEIFLVIYSFGKFEAIPDNMTPEEILEQAQSAAQDAATTLTLRCPDSKVFDILDLI